MTERLSSAQLDEVLAGVLRVEPPARLVAIAESGVFVPMPASVPLSGHPVIVGPTSALSIVVPEDFEAVISAWTQARELGSSRGVVRLLVAPEQEVDLVFVDARHRHGVYVGAVIGAPETMPDPCGASTVLRPRYGVARKDELGILTDCDSSYLAMLGYRREELVGRRSLDIIHPDDHARAIANWMELLARPGQSSRTRLRHLRGDGTWLWLEVTNHNVRGDGANPGVVGECVDISEETAATEALRASEELLRRLTDALPVGVVQLDADGRVAYRNDQLVAVLGATLEAGEDLAERFTGTGAGGDALAAAVRSALADGRDADVELPWEAGRGATRRVLLNLRALHGADGVTGAVACVSDVTEAAQLREVLAHQATFDALTGCLTRRALLTRLEELLASECEVTALFIDLDGFKPINDRFGHAVGDDLLRHVGRNLLHHVGDSGLVGRLGGDEFLVVTTAPADDAQAVRAAEAVAEAVSRPLDAGGVRLVARASVGVARAQRGTGADALVAAADERMYRTKAARRVPASAR